MNEPSSPQPPSRTPKIWIGLLLIALLGACGVIYHQHQQAQLAVCAANLVEMRVDFVKFKQVSGHYPATWKELSDFTGTQLGFCPPSGTWYTLHPNADGSVGMTCNLHHTLQVAPP